LLQKLFQRRLFMWNQPNSNKLAQIPNLYETEKIPLKNKIIHHHFFIGGCDWYIAEFDGEDIFWGFVILNATISMLNGDTLLS
jgi:hypothetical protein